MDFPEKITEEQKKNRDKWAKWAENLSPEKKNEIQLKCRNNKNERWKTQPPEKREKELQRMSDYSKEHNAERKRKIIYCYSKGTMRCMNPNCEVPGGAKDIKSLTVDHINGGGKKQERELRKKGINFYDWLIKNNFPMKKEELQVLCYNCQSIKRVEKKECCHRTSSYIV